jgi:hypothetical protein
MQVPSARFEVDDGVYDELARAVPRSLSAAIDLENRVRQCPRTAKAGLIAGPADCIDRIMLEEQELFIPDSGKILADQPVLQIQCLPVFNPTKPLDFDGFHESKCRTKFSYLQQSSATHSATLCAMARLKWGVRA